MKQYQAFYFKQFKVFQDKAAMKIGTDGVLLGAWCPINNARKILDIGTGTGLISLMLAQRSEANIDAIEIEKMAFEQARENFSISKWSERLEVFHQSLQDFSRANQNTYDLIVCNPPFFQSDQKLNPRSIARQNSSLSYEELFSASSNLLTQNGKFSLIVPSVDYEKLVEIAIQYDLFPKQICFVKGNLESKPKRILINFSRLKTKTETSELAIELERHVYTEDYLSLTKDFYLNFPD